MERVALVASEAYPETIIWLLEYLLQTRLELGSAPGKNPECL